MIRRGIDERTRIRSAEALVYRLVNLPAVRHARCIGVYHAYGSELSLQPAIDKLREENSLATIAYPLLVSEDSMAFVSFASGQDTTVLEQPAAIVTDIPRDRIIDISDLDIVLVPGLAFDEQGGRLGQGGGHFDRVLPRVKPEAVTIGIAFDEQVIDGVPMSAHDKRVDYVLTPSRLIAV